jgi:hypothetical protein
MLNVKNLGTNKRAHYVNLMKALTGYCKCLMPLSFSFYF